MVVLQKNIAAACQVPRSPVDGAAKSATQFAFWPGARVKAVAVADTRIAGVPGHAGGLLHLPDLHQSRDGLAEGTGQTARGQDVVQDCRRSVHRRRAGISNPPGA